jgi:transcriptional regulator with XRE-family HTH domain
MPKEKPKVNIGEVIRSYRSDRGLSQGDIERRTGLLRWRMVTPFPRSKRWQK